ncbi:hypothetical protein LBMAG21_11010 [Armatimonadota bacterium]|nr:hypothetical protein LBMAG21_11010 [Armatimonadota bacterium]
MKHIGHWHIALAALLLTGISFSLLTHSARKGPFNPETLPPTIDSTKKVHFVTVDNAFTPPNENWIPNLKILTGGDHTTEAVSVGGHTGVKVMGIKFNTADDLYPMWANEHTVDILMQFYGDSALLNPDGSPCYFNFLTGTLPEPIAMDGGELPAHAKNGKWNWVLFRVPNGLRHMDGGRLIGTMHPKSKKDAGLIEVSKNSGQNGGTIRMDGLHEFKVRFVAFGQQGAFGEPEQINHFKR